ncbi:MAG: rod shape-determining protein [Phycisphaerae bacterium]|jgi:rod shape-determining protein MreB|nr:rod shape-determining protein [Phycisphaerae bacterium]
MIFDRLIGLFSTDMGIDLGTATTKVCVRGRGIVLCEPSVVAIHKDTGKVLLDGMAVGEMAKRMLGKTPASIQAIRPLKEGVIADFNITEAMLNYFIRQVHDRRSLIKPRVVIAIPSGITEVEKRAVRSSAARAGARKSYLVVEPLAAAIGAGLPIKEPTASMIIDIGGGTSEMAVSSLGDIACSESVRIGGDDFDEAIIEHMKKTYSLLIGPQTAERIKIQIGSAYRLEQELTMEVGGRDLIAGLPRRTVITSQEVREAIAEPVQQIVEAVKQTLERTEPELSADLTENGIVMCGGGALLRGLDTVVAQATGLAVRIADEPITCVARGTGVFLDHIDSWRGTFEDSEDEV